MSIPERAEPRWTVHYNTQHRDAYGSTMYVFGSGDTLDQAIESMRANASVVQGRLGTQAAELQAAIDGVASIAVGDAA